MSWTAVADDGHVMSGTFKFSVGEAKDEQTRNDRRGRGAALLRALVYAGSVAAAGGVLYALFFPHTANMVGRHVRRQIALGCAVLVIVEPLRYRPPTSNGRGRLGSRIRS